MTTVDRSAHVPNDKFALLLAQYGRVLLEHRWEYSPSRNPKSKKHEKGQQNYVHFEQPKTFSSSAQVTDFILTSLSLFAASKWKKNVFTTRCPTSSRSYPWGSLTEPAPFRAQFRSPQLFLRDSNSRLRAVQPEDHFLPDSTTESAEICRFRQELVSVQA